MPDEPQALTAADILKEVENAIVAVAAGGQSYKIGSRSMTRANLTELRKMRDALAAEVAATGSDNLMRDTYVAEFEGR